MLAPRLDLPTVLCGLSRDPFEPLPQAPLDAVFGFCQHATQQLFVCYSDAVKSRYTLLYTGCGRFDGSILGRFGGRLLSGCVMVLPRRFLSVFIYLTYPGAPLCV